MTQRIAHSSLSSDRIGSSRTRRWAGVPAFLAVQTLRMTKRHIFHNMNS
jgi:hypothetical protein